MDLFSFILGLLTGVIGLSLVSFGLRIVTPWLRLKMRRGKGSLAQVLAIRLRGNPPTLLIDAYTSLLHAGKATSLRELEMFYVAQGHPISTAAELISLFNSRVDSQSPR